MTNLVNLGKYLEENLVENYPNEVQDIDSKVDRVLDMLLDRWKSYQSLEKTFEKLEFGIKNYTFLDYPTQKKLLQIKKIVTSSQSNRFVKDKAKSQIYKKIYAIFLKLKHSRTTNEKYELRFQPIDPSFTLLEFFDKNKLSDQMKEELRLKEQKKTKIIEFYRDFFKDYLPVIFGSDKSPTEIVLEKRLKKDSNKIFESIADVMCSMEPRNLSLIERKIIVNITLAATSFFTELNNAISFLKRKKVNFKTISIADEEVLLITQINSQLISAKKEVIIPNDQDYVKMLENIQENIEKTIKEYLKDNTKKDFYAFIVSSAALVLIEKMINPYMMCVLLDRILIDGIIIEGIEEKTAPLKNFSAKDRNFSENLGQSFYLLSKQFIRLGRPSGMFKAISSILTRVLKSKADELGVKAQKGMNQILNSTSVIRPILIVDHLLYKKKDGVRIPTLTQTFNKSTLEKKKFQMEMADRVKGKLYPFILANIKPHIPKTFTWAAKQMTSIKDFCETLSSRLYRFTQQPKLIKLLIVYIIRALKP